MSSEITFGRFLLSVPHRQLWHDGVRVPLKPKEINLLVLLAERRPAIVSRDEIIDRLWHGIASDAAVSQTVYRLRQALARYDETDFIRTLPEAGFQLNGGTLLEVKNSNPDFRHPAFARYQSAALLYSRRTERSVLECVEMLEAVLAEDPNFSAAQLLLAKAYTNAGIRLIAQPSLSYWRARTLLERIIDADPTNGDAFATLSTLLLFATANRSNARDAAERALLLSPRSPVAHYAAVWERISRRDFTAALTQADLGMIANPGSAHATAMTGTVLYMSGQYAEARGTFDVALMLDGTQSTALFYSACIEAMVGDAAAASILLDRITGADISARVVAVRGYLAGKYRDVLGAERAMAELEAMPFPSEVSLCAVLLALGRREAAAFALTRALKTQEPGLFLTAVDPMYAPLWPQFPELFKRIGIGRAPQCDHCGAILTIPQSSQALHRRAFCWSCRQRLAGTSHDSKAIS